MPGPPAGRPRLPIDSALRLVIRLMFVNLGLSVITTVITLFLRNSVIDYQLAHLNIAPGTPQDHIDILRQSLETGLWAKLVASVLVSALYIWRAFALRRGSRGAYLRLYYIAIVGILGIAYLIFSGQYPVWMRVEQILQAIVLVALLVAVSRPQVRNRFSKQQPGY